MTVFLFFILSIILIQKVDAKIEENKLPLFGKIITIDSGHGGRDPGAIVGSIYEKDINLEMSKVLEQKLLEKGAIVYMIREEDEDLSSKWDAQKKRGDLYRRILKIQQNKSDIYLSIHMNYHEDSGYRGQEVLYNPINSNNKILGDILMQQFKKDFNTKRHLKKTNLYLYSNTRVPGVLIECGFLSNYHDRANLQNPKYQNEVATSIVQSVITYFSVI